MKFSALVGSPVLDASGQRIGRLTDATAEIRFNGEHPECVLRDLYIKRFGLFDPIAGWRLVQALLSTMAPYPGFREFTISADVTRIENGTITVTGDGESPTPAK